MEKDSRGRSRKVFVENFFEKAVLIDHLAWMYRNELARYPKSKEGLTRLMKDLEKIYKTEVGEVFQRPSITLSSHGDCDDQTICLAGWCWLHGIDYWIVFMGQGRVTHVSQEIRTPWDGLVLVDALPYPLPADAKIYCKVRGRVQEWFPQGEALLGPVVDKYLEKVREWKKESMEEIENRVTDSLVDEFGRRAWGDDVSDEEMMRVFEAEKALRMHAAMSNLNPVEAGIIDMADAPAYEAEIEAEKRVARDDTMREEKEIARAAIRRKNR